MRQFTFDRMVFNCFPPRALCQELCCFFLAPLKLLHTLVMIIHSDTQNLLGTVLSNHELVQVLLQDLGCHPGSSEGRSRRQGPGSGQSRLITTAPGLTRKV